MGAQCSCNANPDIAESSSNRPVKMVKDASLLRSSSTPIAGSPVERELDDVDVVELVREVVNIVVSSSLARVPRKFECTNGTEPHPIAKALAERLSAKNIALASFERQERAAAAHEKAVASRAEAAKKMNERAKEVAIRRTQAEIARQAKLDGRLDAATSKASEAVEARAEAAKKMNARVVEAAARRKAQQEAAERNARRPSLLKALNFRDKKPAAEPVETVFTPRNSLVHDGGEEKPRGVSAEEVAARLEAVVADSMKEATGDDATSSPRQRADTPVDVPAASPRSAAASPRLPSSAEQGGGGEPTASQSAKLEELQESGKLVGPYSVFTPRGSKKAAKGKAAEPASEAGADDVADDAFVAAQVKTLVDEMVARACARAVEEAADAPEEKAKAETPRKKKKWGLW